MIGDRCVSLWLCVGRQSHAGAGRTCGARVCLSTFFGAAAAAVGAGGAADVDFLDQRDLLRPGRDRLAGDPVDARVFLPVHARCIGLGGHCADSRAGGRESGGGKGDDPSVLCGGAPGEADGGLVADDGGVVAGEMIWLAAFVRVAPAALPELVWWGIVVVVAAGMTVAISWLILHGLRGMTPASSAGGFPVRLKSDVEADG